MRIVRSSGISDFWVASVCPAWRNRNYHPTTLFVLAACSILISCPRDFFVPPPPAENISELKACDSQTIREAIADLGSDTNFTAGASRAICEVGKRLDKQISAEPEGPAAASVCAHALDAYADVRQPQPRADKAFAFASPVGNVPSPSGSLCGAREACLYVFSFRSVFENGTQSELLTLYGSEECLTGIAPNSTEHVWACCKPPSVDGGGVVPIPRP